MAGQNKPRFLVDSMLGNVARKMRILGYDAVYSADMPDQQILEQAARSGRIIITRDAELSRRAAKMSVPTIPVAGNPEPLAMSEIIRALNITPDISGESARCTICNGDTARITGEEAGGRVPDGVRRRTGLFWECRECRHVYWEGTHIRNLREAAREWART